MVDKLPLPPSTIEQPAKSQGIFAVPNFLTAYFTGREDLLQNIHALLAEKHVVALHGLGGVGKTQTLLEYARLHRTDYPVVLWMAAESEHSFQQGFLKLAQDLGCRCQSTR
jgi:ABC-type phosphate/phosphonate transport system ATPase subunit